MGPLINAKQHARVLDYMRASASRRAPTSSLGGGVPTGDAFERGFFVEPTLFDGVDPHAHRARRRSSARCWR